MLNHDVQVRFLKFQPSPGLRARVASYAYSLQRQAPSDATLFVQLTKQNGTFTCDVRVQSQVGPFMTSENAKTATQALKKARLKINNQISAWQTHRFQPHERAITA